MALRQVEVVRVGLVSNLVHQLFSVDNYFLRNNARKESLGFFSVIYLMDLVTRGLVVLMTICLRYNY